MFRRKKSEDKAKLEHKLYLARENPEPVFDLSDCNLQSVPQGIYSLCRVFLKTSLLLNRNCLTSLRGGGQLNDLHLLEVLNIQYNNFSNLPEEVYLLKSLKELYVNNNKLKLLPKGVGKLGNLKVLDLSHNLIKQLPEEIGDLTSLRSLRLRGNSNLKNLPKSICRAQRLIELELDSDHMEYPPAEVVVNGLEEIMQYICKDVGFQYVSPNELQEFQKNEETRPKYEDADPFQEKIWKLEKLKQQKMQDFLEIERSNQLLQMQEIELSNAVRANRQKLLEEIASQQGRFDNELNKLHQIKEMERFKLIEQLQEAEQNADIAIRQLLALNNEPQAHLLEQEKIEEERLLSAINKYEALRKDDILEAMKSILQQETELFELTNKNRIETSQSILEQEFENDARLSEVLQDIDVHKAALVAQLQNDRDLQKAAVGTLLERGDARSWGLLQQVRLVEAQLAALTHIELDRKKLEIDHHINDLAEKRVSLSILLLDLLEQQKIRRGELLSTLKCMEDFNNDADDFWLKQYQRLLDKLPVGLSEAQKNIDPVLGQSLILNGVAHCLPFLAKLTQCQYEIGDISDEDLMDAGVLKTIDRAHILDAFRMYKKEKNLMSRALQPTAPVLPVEEATAPMPENTKEINTSECVICLDTECQVIFVPCGHLCCCVKCCAQVAECPMCRGEIERKIKVIVV